MKVELKLNSINKIPNLKNPILICGFPGTGYVGKLAVEHLIEELNGKLIGEIFSYSFPPQLMIKSDGIAESIKNSIHIAKINDKRDGIFITGDAQPITPDGNYQVSDKIINFAKELGVREVFTLAAYITGDFVDKPKVFGTATNSKLVQKLESNNVQIMKEGSITGMNGILIGVGKIMGLKGASLLGETSGYIIDAKASQVVLEVLNSIFDTSIDLTNLSKKAKETENLMKNIEKSGNPNESVTQEKEKDRKLGYIS